MLENQKSGQMTWKSQTGFIWSLMGSAVGFANILSFSAQVYKNGGGAFLIPYFMALFVLGIPLLILEGMIGHQMKSPLVSAYGKIWGQAGKVMGWLAVLACLSIGAFYIVLTGYSAAYTYFSAINAIPLDSKAFFVHTFLQTTTGLLDIGEFSFPIFISTMTVAVIAWFVLVRNVRDGIEKICSFFMPLLALIMTLFAISVAFLPGGLNGWVYYLKPDFSKLSDPSLWRDVFGQLFFSLSLGLGIIVGYSRHTGNATNIPKAMICVALGDFLVSFIAGAAIFGCLAHISYIQQVPFDSILTTDSTFEIGFVVFPHLFKFFGPLLGRCIGVIFFFCIFVAGITGVFSIVESIAGNIEIEFKINRKKAVTSTLIALVFLATFFCMGNASYLIDALAPMVIGTNMLVGGIALIVVFQYFGSKLTRNSDMKIRWCYPYLFCLRYIAPILLVTILIGNIYQEIQTFNLAKAVGWGWLIVALLISVLITKITPKDKIFTTVSAIN
jgi:neurotransmitter:Na+ symporter, NSS family